MNKENEELARHVTELDPNLNGGETILLITKFISNGDPVTATQGVFTNQEVSLQSYGNSATIQLYGPGFTPEFLRKWANELEQTRNKLVK